MPIFVEGYIEYLHVEDYSIEDSVWSTWMLIESIIVFNDIVNHKIFGNPRDFKDNKENCIAKERGFPNNPSYLLKKEIIEKEKFHESGELFGFTHFLYSEINQFDWKSFLSGEHSNWLDLFELIEQFMKIKNLEADKIRFVTWYNW